MNNTYSFLRSKTFWTMVAMFVVGGLTNVSGLLPSGTEPYVMAFLGIMGTYFHVTTVKALGGTN